MVEENNQWILESSMTTSKMESQSASTATSIATWQKNIGRRRKRKLENVSNVTKKDILQRTVKGNSLWRNEKSKRNQTMKETTRRDLAKILSRHSIRDLFRKFSE